MKGKGIKKGRNKNIVEDSWPKKQEVEWKKK